MRVAIGGIEHETNTYATASMGPTTLNNFATLRGDEFERTVGTRTTLGGFAAAAERIGCELVPTLWAMAGPSGIIERTAYETLRDELLDRVRAVGPVDAVVLSLHGAGVADGVDDLEGDLVRSVRTIVGDVPIVVTLDLHGNITTEMAEAIDVMLGVHEYPHVDFYDRGVEAIELLPGIVDCSLRPTSYVQPVPIMLTTSTTDPGFPAAAMRDRCLASEQSDGVVDATFFHGFPYTDVPASGCSIVVTTNDDAELAERTAKDLAAELWAHRNDFLTESIPPPVAVELAIRAAERGGPVVINETSDNPGGGTPGDGTHLLRAMIDAGLDERACFGFVFDARTAAAAHEAGVGAMIDVRLGGHHGDLHGETIESTAYVKTLTDGHLVYTNPMLEGTRANFGPSARLRIGGRDGLDVIVTSQRRQTLDAEIFTLHGIDVTTRSIVALKSSQHFRAGFRDIATEIVTADGPGLTTLDVTVFEHERAPGPHWPHHPTMTWQPDPGAGPIPDRAGR
ncbi:MAG: M81 family metallopeptidase [Actinomycetota bacterium]